MQCGRHALKQQRVFTKHSDDIFAVALHPDGQTVATGQVPFEFHLNTR
jgi:WD40 repeat protein